MEQVTAWIEGFADQVQSLGYAIGVIAVLVLGIVLVAGGRDGLQKGKGMAISIIAGIAVLSFGVAIVSSLRG